eukprot:5642872-Amphidinium_carterae.1
MPGDSSNQALGFALGWSGRLCTERADNVRELAGVIGCALLASSCGGLSRLRRSSFSPQMAVLPHLGAVHVSFEWNI